MVHSHHRPKTTRQKDQNWVLWNWEPKEVFIAVRLVVAVLCHCDAKLFSTARRYRYLNRIEKGGAMQGKNRLEFRHREFKVLPKLPSRVQQWESYFQKPVDSRVSWRWKGSHRVDVELPGSALRIRMRAKTEPKRKTKLGARDMAVEAWGQIWDPENLSWVLKEEQKGSQRLRIRSLCMHVVV